MWTGSVRTRSHAARRRDAPPAWVRTPRNVLTIPHPFLSHTATRAYGCCAMVCYPWRPPGGPRRRPTRGHARIVDGQGALPGVLSKERYSMDQLISGFHHLTACVGGA